MNPAPDPRSRSIRRPRALLAGIGACLLPLHAAPAAADSEAALAAIRAGSPETAREACADAAETGDAACQNVMGWLALTEGPDPGSAEEARGWFERAAAQGHPKALANLAYMLGGGRGGEQDLERAAKLYRQAREARAAPAAAPREAAPAREEPARAAAPPPVDEGGAREAGLRSAFAEILRIRILHGLREDEGQAYVTDAELADAERAMAGMEAAAAAAGIRTEAVQADVEKRQELMLRLLSRGEEGFDPGRRQDAIDALGRIARIAGKVR